jgi:4-alpha-glucanotransferase
MEPSPYFPTTRRFANPIYLRVEDIPEYAYLPLETIAGIAESAESVRAALNRADAIDRDRAWQAKLGALETLYAAGLRPPRQVVYDAYRRREGAALDDFAAWCVLCEKHGTDWHGWPEEFRNPASPAVGDLRRAEAGRLDFYRWLQWQLDEQLSRTQAAARDAGMPLGVLHDLAVGVSGRGADSWALQRELALGVTVGAPADPFSDTGQDWGQPPWRPDRLAELGYAPLREMVRAVLRHAGGLRVDHIIGLFRLWWIPEGCSPTAGTYVRYDHDAAIGILALEAERADAVVIGEDLGNVEPWVRGYLSERGILGTSVLWFEYDPNSDHAPLPPERWRECCLASVTTHDLPPTAGYLAGDHIRLRHRLGLTAGSLDDALAADRREQQAWLDVARSRGLLPTDDPRADVRTTVAALHRLLTSAPSRLRLLALTDAVGDRRTQNQPGTRDEYPNWRVALTGPDDEVLWLEDVLTSARAAELAEILRQ